LSSCCDRGRLLLLYLWQKSANQQRKKGNPEQLTKLGKLIEPMRRKFSKLLALQSQAPEQWWNH